MTLITVQGHILVTADSHVLREILVLAGFSLVRGSGKVRASHSASVLRGPWTVMCAAI